MTPSGRPSPTKARCFSQPGGEPMKIGMRDETRIISNDVHVMTMYHVMGAEGEMKVMEIAFTRKK